MKTLDRLYSSSGSEEIIDTVQLVIGDDVFWLVEGYDDIIATLEDGTEQRFEGSSMDIALPARNADGTQDLKYAISNIDGRPSAAIKKARENGSEITITYRKYLSTDFGAPQENPVTLTVKSGYWTATELQATAGYLSILDWAWPRHRYTLAEYQALRYTN
ncbi:TPA: DUF1833 family protein [Klebsiella michiganensis]